jgi:ribosome maturation factor RimP
MKRLTLLSALLPALFAPGLFASHMAERGGGDGDSKIEKELLDVTDLSRKRGEARQDYISRLLLAVRDLSDKEWDGLSKEAQDWFNSAADAKNAKADTLPDFPDLPKPEAETTGRRRGSADKEEERVTKVGDEVTVKTKRGKEVTGKVVELDKEVIVLKTADGEEEFALDRVDTITHNHGTAGGKEEPEDPFAKGASVLLVTKRGKEVVGKILEIDDEVVVLDVDGKEEEFARDRVESIKPKGSKEASGTSRRAAAADSKDDKGGDEKKRSSNPPGVSVGMRIKEIIAADLEISMEDVGKLLKKEGLEFKDTSLKMNYDDCAKFLACLKAAKRLK